MRLRIVVSIAVVGLGLPRAVLAQGEEIDPAADGGVAPDEAPLVIEIVEETDIVPAPQPTPAPAPASTPVAQPPKSATPRANIPPPAHPWPNFRFQSGTDHNGRFRGAHSRKSRRGAALSFIPFLAAGVVSAGVIGLAAVMQQKSAFEWDHGTTTDADREKENEDSHMAARTATLAVVPITGVIATTFFSLMLNSAYSRGSRDFSVFGAAFVGALLGLVVDVGLACILYFTTDSVAAVVAPSLVGLVALPPIGGAIGAYVARRSRRSPGFVLLPAVPTAIAVSSGRAVPGLALGGVF